MGATRSAAPAALLWSTRPERKRGTVLAARPDGDIDYSEIPPLTAKFWTDAARGRFYKPIKTSTTVRIDADVLAWLRAQGKGYQSRINAILRREMLASVEGEIAGELVRKRSKALAGVSPKR